MVIFGGCKQQPQGLTGSWKFVADQQLDESGHVVAEDRNVDGLLVYTATGQMSVQLVWFGTRQPLITDTVMNADGVTPGIGLGTNKWSDKENRAWIDSYDAYFGEYQIDEKNKVVTHRINGNLRPEKKFKEYKRSYQLTGDTLYLKSTDPAMEWRTIWVRK
ncbi:lipocalin-like domain-containing protein [Pollutibacter soli]|uniref:lipocalin-like domain-containing protein n=1 Tax=Pollutibacter soli TaxID=3034157 RepID=UPI0030139203